MPSVSKAQNAAMHAAAEGRSTLGIPKRVGQEFVKADAGRKVGALPEHHAAVQAHITHHATHGHQKED